MKIDVYTSSGAKKGSVELPAALFEVAVNEGLVHQAVVLQQSNRRRAIAHAKSRAEVVGSTKKAYQQKGTGRARRGPIRSPLLRGGGKAFGPKSNRNFSKDMPKNMRRNALLSSLSLQAKNGAIVGLESYPDTVKTKDAAACLAKITVASGKRVLIVTPGKHRGISLSTRNIPGVRAITAAYLNPEDVLAARHIVFFVDAIAEAEKLFGARKDRTERAVRQTTEVASIKSSEKTSARKPSKKKASTSSATSK